MRPTLLRVALLLCCAAPPALASSAPATEVAEPVPVSAPLAPVDPRSAAASTNALQYLEWTARPHAPSDVLPTVIVLHGWGASPEKILPIAQFEDLDVRVIAPQAPLKSGRGYTWMNRFRDDGSANSATAQADAAMADLVALVERLRDERPMSGKPVLVGFSLGGSMAYGLSIFRPELFEQVVILSGPMPPKVIPEVASAAQAALPIRALHIEADPVVNARGSEASILMLAAAGFDATFQSFPGGRHLVSDDERTWLHDALLRSWPGIRTP